MTYSNKVIARLCLGVAASAFLVSGQSQAQITCDPVQYVDRDGNDVIGPKTTTQMVIPNRCTWKSGDAGQECVLNLGYDFGVKIDGWDRGTSGMFSGACDDKGSCDLANEFNNNITITNNDGTFFDWSSSPFDLGAVVVKGGTDANVFTYDPAVNYDTGLYSPINAKNGKMFGVSHATFCWNKQDNPGECYGEETAWAVGNDYNTNGKGSWAMYVDYAACDARDGVVDGTCTTDIRAGGGDGVGTNVGVAVISPSATMAGYVEISITLEDGAIFYYDLGDDVNDENLKVQDYANPPKGNPKIGRFKYKDSLPVGSTDATILAPVNNYYGIHLDVAVLTDCE